MQEIFEKYCKIIQSNELFEGIDEKNLSAVLENLKAVIKHYVKGEYIRMRGEAANFIGIVLEGELHIRGRIQIYVLCLIAFRLWRNQDVCQMYQEWKQ